MNLSIQNSETTLVLSDINNLNWHLNFPNYRRRVSLQDRYGKAGGFVSGDREIAARDLTLESDLTGENDAAFFAQLDQIVSIFDPDKTPYYLIDTDNSKRAEVELDRIDPNARKGLELIHAPIRIDLIMVESYWEDTTATTVESESGGMASGDTLTVDNGGVVNTYPVFTITPTDSNSAFSILNNTTNDIITIGSNSFTVGTTMEIDCQNGTITLSDGTTETDISASISDGTGFLYLAPGENSIEYSSSFGAIDVSVVYRKRYAF